jgi:hypothetical protein
VLELTTAILSIALAGLFQKGLVREALSNLNERCCCQMTPHARPPWDAYLHLRRLREARQAWEKSLALKSDNYGGAEAPQRPFPDGGRCMARLVCGAFSLGTLLLWLAGCHNIRILAGTSSTTNAALSAAPRSTAARRRL